MEQQDQLLFQVNDAQERADKYLGELKQLREMKSKMDGELKEAQSMMDVANPAIIKEQKDLIMELRQKVGMLERELSLIVKHNNEEVARLNAKQKSNSITDKEPIEEMGVSKARQVLQAQKGDLEEAYRQISMLKTELKTQQQYFEDKITSM